MIDLTGKRFGRWTVIERAQQPPGRSKGTWWLCRCDCGTSTPRKSETLRYGSSTGCLSCPLGRRDAIRLEPGTRFGRLTVVRFVAHSEDPKTTGTTQPARHLMRCDCGRDLLVARGDLERGLCKQCGVCAREAMRSHVQPEERGYCRWCKRERRPNEKLAECSACERRALRNGRDESGRPTYIAGPTKRSPAALRAPS